MHSYLYGLILARNAPNVPAQLSGLAAAPVRVLECDVLAALVASIDRQPRRTVEDIRAHDKVLQAVVDRGTTVAAGRFGQIFPSDDDTCAHVNAHGGRVARLLEDCNGCVEMRLLLTTRPPLPDAPPALSDPPVGPGRAYLERVKADRDAISNLALRAALGPVVRAERVEALPSTNGFAFAHLIQRTEESTYREAVSALPALAAATIVGPLALYAFAEPSPDELAGRDV